MAEFTATIGTPSGGFTLKVEYSYTQDITNNTSSLTVTGYVKRNNSSYYPYNSTSSVVLTINGTSYSFSPSYNLNTDSYVKLCTKTVTISHNTDGTKSVGISLKMDGKLSSYYPNGTISKTITLTTIPRASTPSFSASSVAMGSSVTINTNRASSSFTHTITYSFGSTSGTIASDVTTSTTWTPPLSLANQIPNAVSGTCTITCKTYSGSTLIGTKTATLTLTVPSSVVPTISSVDVSEGNSVVPSDFGYVQNKSKLKVVTTASGVYSSTISSYKITGIDNNTYTSSNFTSNTLTQSGNKTITVTVTDSRGRTATSTINYVCVPYSSPSISTATAVRCNSDGTDNEEGTYVKYTFKAAISAINNKNTHEFKIGYKKTDESTYTYVTIENDSYILDKSNTVLSEIIFNEDDSYDIQFLANDYFVNTILVQALATGFTLMDFNSSGKAMAIGKVSQAKGNEKLFEMALPMEVSESLKKQGYDVLTTADIIDNLTGEDTDKPLSAKQGKELNDTKVTAGEKSIVANATNKSSYIVLGSFLICWGRTSITPSAANTPTKGSITFPKKFAYTPVLQVAPFATSPQTVFLGLDSPSTAGVNVYLTKTNTSSVLVDWLAIGQASE